MIRFISRAGVDFPAEFASPDKAAERIAALNTIAEREALYLRLPADWQPMVSDYVVPAISRRIYAMPRKLDRQNAIHSVPDLWREQVKKMVMSFWETRHLRPEGQQQVAA